MVRRPEVVKGIKKPSFYSNCMKRLSPRVRRNKYVGFDVETIGKYNKFYSGGLYWLEDGEEKFKYFTDKEAMSKFILSRRFRNYYIVATNLGFDFTVLFYETKYWNDFKLLMRSGNIIQATYKFTHNNGSTRFVDTSNYAFMSVEKLGTIIGTQKLEKPSFLGKRKPKTIEECKELKEYNKFDCKISHDFMLFFQEGVNALGGSVKLTIASTIMHTWRMNFQPVDMLKEAFITQDDTVKDFIFNGYYGGRTEVFKRGKFDNVHYYDVNSLYPFSMINKFPLPQSVKKIPHGEESINNILKYEGVSECLVYCEDMNIPFLPLRMNDKLCFPEGRFTGVWNNNELRKAISLGYNILPLKQIIYTETFEPFTDFVKSFYALRQKYKQENNPYEFVVKIMMNSLYGKFGMRHIEVFKVYDMKYIGDDYNKFSRLTKGFAFDVEKGKLIIKEEKEFDGIYSFPILASYVTSYARIHMYDYITKGGVIYTDTDSIISTEKIQGCDTELGHMKYEGEYSNSVFVKPKMYCLGEKYVKVKGVNKATYEDFIAMLAGHSIKKQKFTRLKESLRRGFIPNSIIDVTKTLTLEDNKREWEHQDLNKVANSKPLQVIM